MNFKKLATLTLSTAIATTVAFADHYSTARPDSHAPIMVMGDHAHDKGEWMVSVRQMRMEMDGMRSGTDSVSSDEVFASNYTVTPTRMTMDMTMLGFMHAPSEKVTFMIMAPYIETEMDHLIFGMAAPLINLNGGTREFTTKSSGFGDVKISALLPFWESDKQKAHYGIGLSLPTGSIGEQDLIPGPGGRIPRQMPAPMQLGSGTIDLLPSVTFLGQEEKWSYGAQASARIRTGENHHDYRLGHQFAATSWIATTPNDSTSISLRANYQYTGEISGTQSDLSLNPPFAPSRRTVTTAFSENYGGQKFELGAGINLYPKEGVLAGHRFALEFTMPVWQDLNGFQLETDYTTTIGWQKAW